jgi:D-aspartate ligase
VSATQLNSRADITVPVLVFKLSRNVIQHGPLGIIRSLGRLGVPVYAIVEDRFAPAATSRYLSGALVLEGEGVSGVVSSLADIGERLGRRAVLIPTDDLAASFINDQSETLQKWFLFPRSPQDLPRRLANKKTLHSLCKSIRVPCAEAEFPRSFEDVEAFIGRAEFPVVLKMAEPQRRPKGTRSVEIVQTARELRTLYRQLEDTGCSDVMFQDYIAETSGEDWVVHGYANPQTDCLLVFTGKKLRSYPAFAGSTTLGRAEHNEPLRRQAEMMLRTIAYAGIMDMDWRLDKRDGQYKLLDFNPRVGANFRMFESEAGVDVVRALYLDITGRSVCRSLQREGHTFIVEPYDFAASLNYMRQGGLGVRTWLQSLKGKKETAWFSWDDLAPFFMLCANLVLRTIERSVKRCFTRLFGSHTKRLRL